MLLLEKNNEKSKLKTIRGNLDIFLLPHPKQQR
jgi:hypothetical protein